MRPTELLFKGPKQRTPSFLYPKSSYDGRSLSMPPKQMSTTIPRSTRFSQTNPNSNGLSFRVGPGSYQLNQQDISQARIKYAPLLRQFHGQRNLTNNGYYMTGNHLVFDKEFAWKTNRRFSTRLVDGSQLWNTLSKTSTGINTQPLSPRKQKSKKFRKFRKLK